MNNATLRPLVFWLLLLVGIAAPLLFPDYTNQIAILWLMIVFSLTTSFRPAASAARTSSSQTNATAGSAQAAAAGVGSGLRLSVAGAER